MIDKDWAYLLGWIMGAGTIDQRCQHENPDPISYFLDKEVCDRLRAEEFESWDMGYMDSIDPGTDNFILGIDARPDIASEGDIVSSLKDCPFLVRWGGSSDRYHLWLRDSDFVFETVHYRWEESASSIAEYKGRWESVWEEDSAP